MVYFVKILFALSLQVCVVILLESLETSNCIVHDDHLLLSVVQGKLQLI